METKANSFILITKTQVVTYIKSLQLKTQVVASIKNNHLKAICPLPNAII
jgi:hypothetical protein